MTKYVKVYRYSWEYTDLTFFKWHSNQYLWIKNCAFHVSNRGRWNNMSSYKFIHTRRVQNCTRSVNRNLHLKDEQAELKGINRAWCNQCYTFPNWCLEHFTCGECNFLFVCVCVLVFWFRISSLLKFLCGCPFCTAF